MVCMLKLQLHAQCAHRTVSVVAACAGMPLLLAAAAPISAAAVVSGATSPSSRLHCSSALSYWQQQQQQPCLQMMLQGMAVTLQPQHCLRRSLSFW